MTDGLDRIEESGVVAVIRGADAGTVVETVRALQEGGVTAVELTADTPGVTDLVEEVVDVFGDDLLVGVGTVLDEETVRNVTLAGAEFVVSPSFHEEVVRACSRHGTTVIPGAMTPTEVIEAYEVGADAVKVFPASTVGPGHVAALQGPLSQVPLVPTGGVTLESAGDFIEAGALAVGAGSALVDRDAVAAGDFETISETAEAFRSEVVRARERRAEKE